MIPSFLSVTLTVAFWLFLDKQVMDRPKCGCGNTQNPNGYCDGSHVNKN